MVDIAIQRFIIRKLMNFSLPKWGASHTEGRNLFKENKRALRKKTANKVKSLS